MNLFNLARAERGDPSDPARLSWALVWMIPLLSPGSAEDVRWIWMQGVGLDSCGKFLAAIEGLPIGKAGVETYPDGRKFVDEAAAYQSWIEGYITGVNVNVSAYEPTREIRVDYPGIELWIKGGASHIRLKIWPLLYSSSS